MTDLTALATYLDKNHCRFVTCQATGERYYVANSALSILGGPSVKTGNLTSHITRLVDSIHFRREILITERGGPQTMLLVSLEGVADYLTKLATPRAVDLRKHWVNGNLGRIKPWVTELPWWKTQPKPVDTAPLELEDDGEDDNEDEDMEDEEEDDEYYEDGDGEYHEDDTVEEDEDDDCIPPPQPNGRCVPGPVVKIKHAMFKTPSMVSTGSQGGLTSLDQRSEEVEQAMVSAPTALVPWFEEKIGNDLEQMVNARDLWKFMESKQKYSDWVKARLKGSRAVEGKHYLRFPNVRKAENNNALSNEYHITLDIAKHFAMLEQTDRGFVIRDYFIQCEKEWRRMKYSPSASSNVSDDMLGMVRLMVQQQGQALSQQATLIEAMVGLSQAVQKMVNKVCPDSTIPNHPLERTIAPPTHFTIVGFASLIGIRVGEKDASAMGRRATKLCGSRGVEFKDVPNGRYGSTHSYPRDILLAVFREYYAGHDNFLLIPPDRAFSDDTDENAGSDY